MFSNWELMTSIEKVLNVSCEGTLGLGVGRLICPTALLLMHLIKRKYFTLLLINESVLSILTFAVILESNITLFQTQRKSPPNDDAVAGSVSMTFQR